MDYIEAFKNLKTNNKYSRKSPHKAVLLLSVIELFENGVLSDNVVRYDETLKKKFLQVWNRTLPGEATFLPDVYLPFWYMQSELFWHIVPLRGKEEILSLLIDTHVKPSDAKLRDCVDYAELDNELYFLMTISSGRRALKRALLETYFSLSEQAIESLSESTNNSIDSSEIAMNQYMEILKPAEQPKTSVVVNVNDEIQRKFAELSEDIQITMNIEYYKFLKNNRLERDMIKELIPSVYHLYHHIADKPYEKDEVPPSLHFTLDNFLSDLKIALICEDGSMDLIDQINDALNIIRGIATNKQDEETAESPFTEEEQHHESAHELTLDVETKAVESDDKVNEVEADNDNKVPLQPSLTNRRGMRWTSEEEEQITTLFNRGYSISEIAETMGRTEVSIMSRLGTLGLIDYVYGEKNTYVEPIPKMQETAEEKEEKLLDFSIINTLTRGAIINALGECVFTINGQLKVINGKPYRFNYKEMCLSVKDIIRDDDKWIIGTKKLVSYPNSDLYPLLEPDHFIEKIEGFKEGERWEDNMVLYDGKWYNYEGYYIRDSKQYETTRPFSATKRPDINETTLNYEPKGQLKKINEISNCSYDILWLMAIVDFMGNKNQNPALTFDQLACMMIANAWEILYEHPILRNVEKSVTACVEFLIEESKSFMDEELSWQTPKDDVFEAISNYPMAGVFEDTVEELVMNSPYHILKLWVQTDDYFEIVNESKNPDSACLYTLYPRKVDPYIIVNKKWSRNLFFENVDLMRYLKNLYVKFLSPQ